jgi:hypothetical protein
MILPPIQGQFCQNSFFIFSACDTHYFKDFGKTLINSILKNSNAGIHFHIFNPSDEQLEYCKSISRLSVTYEYVPLTLFDAAVARWNIEPTNELEKLRYSRIVTSMNKGKDSSLAERIQKTYYACARFIRLNEITNAESKFFAMDVDAVLRKEVPTLSNLKDCYLHMITGKKARVLAGGIYATGNCNGKIFLKEYSDLLEKNINNDYLYWSLDQDCLDVVVPKYNIGELPITLIDWEMRPESVVWTAKGLRKDNQFFIGEQKKYTV